MNLLIHTLVPSFSIKARRFVGAAETGAYRYDGEHVVSLRVSEEDVDEGDDLQRLAEAHAVGQDASESAAVAEALHRLDQVVVQETDSTNLEAQMAMKTSAFRPRVDGGGLGNMGVSTW